MGVLVNVSHGELLDKISILEIKAERIKAEAKLRNVKIELAQLRAAWEKACGPLAQVAAHHRDLRRVNERLWDIEDRIRIKEREADFDAEFVELARQVYITNDQRARLKRVVNEACGSDLVEEKQYTEY